MSIITQQYRRPNVKARWQVPLGVAESIVAYNCRKYGFPVPVLAMPFWEGAGNKVYDVSGKMNHGTLTNGVAWKGGKFGNALSFDGVDDYVNVLDNSILDITANISIESWIKGTSISDNDFFIYKGGAYCLGYGQTIFGLTSDKFGFTFSYGGVWQKVSSTTSSSNNIWYHVVGTYDGANLKIYVNGILENTIAFVGTIDASDYNINLGAYSKAMPTYNFNGLIDDVRIYNRALTPAKVKFLYDNPFFMYEMPEEMWGSARYIIESGSHLIGEMI